MQSDPAAGERITIRNLQGSVSLENLHGGGGLFSVFKSYGLPLILIHLGFFAVLFDLLRRLFRNVERGDSFTQRNIRLLHIIGVSILLFTFISAAVQWRYLQEITSYLNQHTMIEGMRMSFTPPANHVIASDSHHFEFQFSWSGILTGLLVLALGEVFRQGLVLKQENELTI
jgi:hypothetical protein